MNRQRIMAVVIAVLATMLTVAIVVAAVSLSRYNSLSASSVSVSPTPSVSPATVPTPGPTSPPSSSAPSTCPPATVTVSTTKDLEAALAAAQPGTVIRLAPGTFVGQFLGKAAGSAASPIWLCGSADSKLDGGTTGSGYVLHLDGASYWHLLGFGVTNGQKGVVTDAANNNTIEGLTVTGIGDEGIHLRSASSNNVVIRNTVSNTGLLKAKFGEGIYVGSAQKNWCSYSSCQPDRSDHNTITANTVSHTTAENIDIKEGTTGGTVSQNVLDGVGMVQSGADSWIDVKGNDWTIDHNHGVNSVNDGFQTHQILDGWGTRNHFTNNLLDVNGPGYGINLTPVLGNTVSCSNIVTGAARGLSNIACTSG